MHAAGDTVTLDGSDAHKILDVLRMRDGDAIEIADSAGTRFSATVAVDGRTVRAALHEALESPPEGAAEIVVAQGIPKGQKMDFVVEKLTELGVSAILPLRSERTIAAGEGSNKLERWRRLAKTAAAQCGRSRIPHVADPTGFDELLAQFGQYDCVLFPWELAERVPARERFPELLAGAKRILIVVGPEGGFSHGEALQAQAAGAHLVSLGSRILRTETAALVVVSILNYLLGV